jgi:hypothetical protein
LIEAHLIDLRKSHEPLVEASRYALYPTPAGEPILVRQRRRNLDAGLHGVLNPHGLKISEARKCLAF